MNGKNRHFQAEFMLWEITGLLLEHGKPLPAALKSASEIDLTYRPSFALMSTLMANHHSLSDSLTIVEDTNERLFHKDTLPILRDAEKQDALSVAFKNFNYMIHGTVKHVASHPRKKDTHAAMELSDHLATEYKIRRHKNKTAIYTQMYANQRIAQSISDPEAKDKSQFFSFLSGFTTCKFSVADSFFFLNGNIPRAPTWEYMAPKLCESMYDDVTTNGKSVRETLKHIRGFTRLDREIVSIGLKENLLPQTCGYLASYYLRVA